MFIDKIKANCEKFKSETAYICGDEHITYGELWEKARNLASYLQMDGKSPCLVYGHKSQYMLICFLACLLSGRAYVPCDISTPFLRIRYMQSVCSSSLMILTEDFESDCYSYGDNKVLSRENLRQICLTKSNCATFQNKDSTAYIIFTSGSTGAPKGVPITVRNLDNFIGWVTSLNPVSCLSRGVVLNQAAFSFDLSIADIFISLTAGHTLFAVTRAEQENFKLLFERFAQSGCSLIVCTPTFMKMCLCGTAFNRSLLPKLQTVFFCGEVLPVKTAEKLFCRFPDIKIINAYGPTEATCAVTAAEIEKSMLALPILPVGKVDKSAVKISLTGLNPSDRCGEIMLRGDSVSRGYLGFSSPAFNSGGYLTGDIGKIENGFLYCLGRSDNQIKYKGYRIEPSEIEYCLEEIEGISGAAVIPFCDKSKNIIRLCAFVEKQKRDIFPDFIKTELSKKLPAYMIPKTIITVEKMPVNTNGKCDKNALKDCLANGR